MPLVSVPAVYDGKTITLLEAPPSDRPYQVLVTFVAPVSEDDDIASRKARFLATAGTWQDERSAEDMIKGIYESRRSRSEPPAL